MQRLRVGLVYDLHGTYPRRAGDPPDADAEHEPEETVRVLEGALSGLACEPVRLGPPHAVLEAASGGGMPRLDAAFSIAEGRGSRNREAWGPVLLDLLGIPALGSDALTLSLSLDKAWTKDVVAAAGVPTPPHAVLRGAAEAHKALLPGPFPLFVKPRWEGTAKGIGPWSRVEDVASLAAAVERVVRDYRQPALVEPFLAGAEYTVVLVGNDPPRALPVLQRALEATTRIGLHALERHAPAGGHAHCAPGRLDPHLEGRLAELAVRAFQALDCRDFARVDLRLDARAEPWFLEINPLPTFARDGSFGVLAEILGRPCETLVEEALAAGLRRLGLRE
jgi:D-alanine-D-alanine ligase